MTRVSLKNSPHFDDFDEDKHFYQILFRPGYAIQVRELNQLQTYYRKQIGWFGKHIFQEGSMVIPGNIQIDFKYDWVEVLGTTANDLLSAAGRELHWIGETISAPNGVKAIVVGAGEPSVSNYVKLFIKYTSGSTSGTATGKFSDEQELTSSAGATYTATTGTNCVGTGTSAIIKDGVYFIHDTFVKVNAQQIVVDASTSSPSARIGLRCYENTITADDDTTLLDNANGSYNYAAPGADRLEITLILETLGIETVGDTTVEEDFIELVRIESGAITKQVTTSTYSEIMKMLARRTHDESGDYTVRPFHVKVKPMYDNGTNDGVYDVQDFWYATEAQAISAASKNFGVISTYETGDTNKPYGACASENDLIAAMESKFTAILDAGKAYVKGFEVETIANTYVNIDAATAFKYDYDQVVDAGLGSYILITNLVGMPTIKSYASINLYPNTGQAGGVIGTARARGIKVNVNAGSGNEEENIYNLYLFDIQMTGNNKFYHVLSIGNTSFTADIKPTAYPLSGSIKIKTDSSETSTISGNAAKWFSNEAEALIEGDWIAPTDGLAGPFQVATTPTSDAELAIVGNITNLTENISFNFVYNELFDSANRCAIYPMPRAEIRSLKDPNLLWPTMYNCQRLFDGAEYIADEAGEVSFSLSTDTNEIFDFQGFSDPYYVCVTDLSGTVETLTLSDSNTDFIDAKTIKITGLTENTRVYLAANVLKSGGDDSDAATKPQNKGTPTASYVVSASGTVDLKSISLGVADVYAIESITVAPAIDSTDPIAPDHVYDTDITDWYTLDNGQRDNYYDVASINLKPGKQEPTGRVCVHFTYFSYAGPGNFFAADSYNSDLIVPDYRSKEIGYNYIIRDQLDFRPRKVANGSFDRYSEFPNGNMYLTYSYYLDRIDLLWVDQNGTFGVTKGIPGVNPAIPETPANAMVLYQIYIKGNTQTPADITCTYRENKRYTMRDIGKLEHRIENLEYYTSLSMLERSTKEWLIPDANGLDRFKNGFIVDNFKGHGIGNTMDPNYSCSVYPEFPSLRPHFIHGNVGLEAKVSPSGVDALYNSSTNLLGTVQQLGDLLFIGPVTTKTILNQPYATNALNVNPYNVSSFFGMVKLDPPQDEWMETKRAPDLIVNEEGDYNSIAEMANGMGTIWNDWQTQQVGAPIYTNETTHVTEWSPGGVKGIVDGQIVYRTAEYLKNHPKAADHKASRDIATTTVTETLTYKNTRTGLKPIVTPKTITTSLGDKVINVAYLPYIRSRVLTVTAKGLKPNTKVYAFFDDVDVSSNCSPNPLVTDNTGSCSGTFTIPSSSPAFKCGTRQFVLTDDSRNGADWTTKAKTTYRAEGMLQTVQNTIVSTRNAEITWSPVSEENTSQSSATSSTVEFGPWQDPIAESFQIKERGGAFLKSVTIYFKKKPVVGTDQQLPINLELHEMVNGIPAPSCFPFGRVMKQAAEISISSDATVGTTFTFDSPVYMKENQEAAFVIKSDSDKYEVWVATKGIDPQTELRYTIIGTQVQFDNPPFGAFFKSANASTWVPDFGTDIKFSVDAYQFPVNRDSYIELLNSDIPATTLYPDPITTYADSNLIRVSHPAHGIRFTPTRPAYTTISGVVGNNEGATELNGISVSAINDQHQILEIEYDSYVIAISGDTASSSGIGGGDTVTATENKQMDVVNFVVGEVNTPETTTAYKMKATSGRAIHGTQTPYTLDTSWDEIVVNDNHYFTVPKLVCSPDNRPYVNGTPTDAASLRLFATMRTTNANVSPYIDTKRLSAITIGNRIDSPNIETNNYSGQACDFSSIVTDAATITFSVENSTISSVNADTINRLQMLRPHNYIIVTGATSNNNKTYRIESINVTGSTLVVSPAPGTAETAASCTIKRYDRYLDELAPTGNTGQTRYISKCFNLATPSTALKIGFAAMLDPSNSLNLYYKTQEVGDSTPFDELDWKAATPDQIVPPGALRDYEYTINDITAFTACAVKIVITGTNTAGVDPLGGPANYIHDLRVIALDS